MTAPLVTLLTLVHFPLGSPSVATGPGLLTVGGVDNSSRTVLQVEMFILLPSGSCHVLYTYRREATGRRGQLGPILGQGVARLDSLDTGCWSQERCGKARLYTGGWSQVKLTGGWLEDGVSRGLGLPLSIACRHPGGETVPTSQTQPAAPKLH